MSLFPYFFRHLAIRAPSEYTYLRPWSLLRQIELEDFHLPDKSQVLEDKDGFKVSVDVEEYTPEEITVKMNGNEVVVEGKHEQRHNSGQGYVSKHFVRKYELPVGYDAKTAKSLLSSDGILTVFVKRALESQEREIPIIHSGTPQNEDNPTDDSKK